MNPKSTPPRFRVFENPESACTLVAAEIARLVRERAVLGRNVVLGLATGKTLMSFYEELVYLHREEALSLKNVITFNLDEFLGVKSSQPGSLRAVMERSFFDHVDIEPKNIHFLSGTVADPNIPTHCTDYEAKISAAGGIDYQLLGIGRNACVGFLDASADPDGRTQRVTIDESVRLSVAVAFGGIDNVPTHAITMGCGTLMESRKIILFAWGSRKSSAVRKAIQGPVSSAANVSFLRQHVGTQFFLDVPAASLLKHN